MHTLRICAVFAAGLMLCTFAVSSPPLERASAQTLAAQAKKKVQKKTPAAAAAPKERAERSPFTVEEDDAAVVPGIPDARAWGDSETDFARLLPRAIGPWLAGSECNPIDCDDANSSRCSVARLPRGRSPRARSSRRFR